MTEGTAVEVKRREAWSLGEWMASFQIRWWTLRRGERVGTDAFGNRYYRDARRLLHGRERRWVLYAGAPEASKVPAEWFGWLHHMMEAPLPPREKAGMPWLRPHQPNRTGEGVRRTKTQVALVPASSSAVQPRYEPWTPDQTSPERTS